MPKDAFTVNGREVRIDYHDKIKDRRRQKINKLIRDICAEDEITGFGRKFEFIFQTDSNLFERQSGNLGYVKRDEVKDGQLRVYLTPKALKKTANFRKTLIHEIEHLKQFYTADILSKNEKINERLREKAEHAIVNSISGLEETFEETKISAEEIDKYTALSSWNFRDDISRGETYLEEYRGLIQSCLEDFLYEGLATYAGKEYGKGLHGKLEKTKLGDFVIPVWNKSNLKISHKMAERKAKSLISTMKSFVKNPSKSSLNDIKDEIRYSKYIIGFHMVYTILIVDKDKKIEDLYDLSHLNFLKLYEESAKEIGMSPIVSLNSGEGNIDYDKEINRWSKKIEKLGSDITIFDKKGNITDEKTRRIIALLRKAQEEEVLGHMKTSEIAEELNISPAETRKRLKILRELEKSGVSGSSRDEGTYSEGREEWSWWIKE